MTIYVAYDGIVKELMYEVDDVATAGQPLLTIELTEEEDEGEGEWCSYRCNILCYESFYLGSFSGCNSKVDQDILDGVTTKQQQTPGSASTTTTCTPTTIPPVTNIPSPVIFTHDKVAPVKGIQAVMVKTMTASGEFAGQIIAKCVLIFACHARLIYIKSGSKILAFEAMFTSVAR